MNCRVPKMTFASTGAASDRTRSRMRTGSFGVASKPGTMTGNRVSGDVCKTRVNQSSVIPALAAGISP